MAPSLLQCAFINRHRAATMPSSTRTIRFSEEQKDRLYELARISNRPVNYLVTNAVERMVENHAAMLDLVKEAERDSAEGRMTPREEVMRQGRSIVEAARSKRRRQDAHSLVAKDELRLSLTCPPHRRRKSTQCGACAGQNREVRVAALNVSIWAARPLRRNFQALYSAHKPLFS
jgi:predicted transcriptional regulator